MFGAVVGLVVANIAWLSVARAQGSVLEDPTSGEFWGMVAQAVQDKRIGALFGLGVALLIFLVRKFAVPRWPKLNTSWALKAFSTAVSVLVVVVPLLLAGQPVTFIGILGIIATQVFAASGAWSVAVKPVVGRPASQQPPPKTDVDAAKTLGGV